MNSWTDAPAAAAAADVEVLSGAPKQDEEGWGEAMSKHRQGNTGHDNYG